MKIYLDFGFGFLKAANDTSQIIFPSIAGELPPDGFSLSSHNQLAITTDDGSWLFGNDALLNSITASHSQDSQWILSPQYKAGVLLAITELTKASRIDVELMIALPYADWQNKELKSSLVNNLAGEHLVKRQTAQRINISFPAKFPIVPQNAATMLAHILDNNGNMLLSPDRTHYPFASINIGSQTVEQSTVVFDINGNGFRWNGIEAQSKTEMLGTYVLTRVIRPIIQKYIRSRIRLDDHILFNAIRSGKLAVGPEEVHIGSWIKAAVQQYTGRILNLCTNTWNDQPPVLKDDLYRLIVSGGGAYIVANELRNWHTVEISSSPQWDVINGMKKLRRMND